MIETLTVSLKGWALPVVQPTLELIVFSSMPRERVVPGVLALYRSAIDTFSTSFKWYQTNVMKTYKALADSGIEHIETMLYDKKALKNRLLGINCHSGPSAREIDLPTFGFFSDEVLSDPDNLIHRSYVRFCLPISEAKDAERVYAFVRSVIAKMEFDSGYCGYACHWHSGSWEIEDALRKVHKGWLTRYPGIAYGEPLALLGFVDFGILGVSWLTMINQCKLERIGGALTLDALSKKGIGVDLIEGEHGVIIRAGSTPEIGDRNHSQLLPLYHRVGRALAQLRVPDEWIEQMSVEGLDAEDIAPWYTRFFKGVE